MFNEIDTNGNGSISFAEFSHFVKRHGVSDEVVRRMFNEVDYYGGDFDGIIDRSEFRNIMNLAGEYKASPAWNALYEKYGREVETERPRKKDENGGDSGGGGGGGKGPCFKFEKGTCTFGDRCKFSHDGGGGGPPRKKKREN